MKINVNITDNRKRRKKAAEEPPPRDVVWPTMLTDELFLKKELIFEFYDGGTTPNEEYPEFWNDLDMTPDEATKQTLTYTSEWENRGQFVGFPMLSTINVEYYADSRVDPAKLISEFGEDNLDRWNRKPIGRMSFPKVRGGTINNRTLTRESLRDDTGIWRVGYQAHWLGEYAAGVTYYVGDVVVFHDRYFACIYDGTHDHEPPLERLDGYSYLGDQAWAEIENPMAAFYNFEVELLDSDNNPQEAINPDYLRDPTLVPDAQLPFRHNELESPELYGSKNKRPIPRNFGLRLRERTTKSKAFYIGVNSSSAEDTLVVNNSWDGLPSSEGMFFNWFDTTDGVTFKVTTEPRYDADEYSGPVVFTRKVKHRIIVLPRRGAYYLRTRQTVLDSITQIQERSLTFWNCHCAASSEALFYSSCPCCGPIPYGSGSSGMENECVHSTRTYTTTTDIVGPAVCCDDGRWVHYPLYTFSFLDGHGGYTCVPPCGSEGDQHWQKTTTERWEAKQVQHVHTVRLIWDRFPNQFAAADTELRGNYGIVIGDESVTYVQATDEDATCGNYVMVVGSSRNVPESSASENFVACPYPSIPDVNLRGEWILGGSYAPNDTVSLDRILTFQAKIAHEATTDTKPIYGKNWRNCWYYAPSWVASPNYPYPNEWSSLSSYTAPGYSADVSENFWVSFRYGYKIRSFRSLKSYDFRTYQSFSIASRVQSVFSFMTAAWRKLNHFIDQDYTDELKVCSKWDNIPYGYGISPSKAGELVGIIISGQQPYFVWRKTDESFSLDVEPLLNAYEGQFASFESTSEDGICGEYDSNYSLKYHYGEWPVAFNPTNRPPSRQPLTPEGNTSGGKAWFFTEVYESDFVDQFSGQLRKLTHIGRQPLVELIDRGSPETCTDFMNGSAWQQAFGYDWGGWFPDDACTCSDFLQQVYRFPVQADSNTGAIELDAPVFMMAAQEAHIRTVRKHADNWSFETRGNYISMFTENIDSYPTDKPYPLGQRNSAGR